MLKKRFLAALVVFLIGAIFFSVHSSSVRAQCCVYGGAGAVEINCEDLFGLEGEQQDCEDAGGLYYEDSCSMIPDCAAPEQCTEDQTQECADGTFITTAMCINGALSSTGDTCEGHGGISPVITPTTITCYDGIKSGDESDIDCGGSCKRCAEGKRCNANSDCKGEFCDENKFCRLDTCGNGICDLDETLETCIYDCGVCADSKVHNEQCDGPASQCVGGTCGSRCECDYTCFDNPPIPTINRVSVAQGERAINLAWTLRVGCSLNELKVYRCDVELGDCIPSYLISTIDERKSSYTLADDDHIQPDRKYCYRIDAYYNEDGAKSSSSASGASFSCVQTGEEKCMEGNAYFCEENKLYRCLNDNNRVLAQDCGDKSYCRGASGSSNAQCVPYKDCDTCNGLFGLFGATGETYQIKTTYGAVSTVSTYCDQNTVKSCYFDATKTDVDKFNFCANINLCYNYASKSACEKDVCGMGGCEWNETSEAASEFGIGVCRPVDKELQDCSLCHTLSTEQRNLFFGACSEDVCKLYGECYYSNKLGCSKKSSVGCDAYTQKDECINVDGAADGGKEIIVDTAYDSLTNKRIGRTNEIRQRSNDYLDLGTCKWKGDIELGECIKDADGDNQSDCSNAVNQIECEADNTPPETSITPDVPVEGSRILLGKEVYLKVDTSEPSFTYFCFVQDTGSDAFCYPNESTACAIQKKVPYDGLFKMFYYSEDRAHNLEPVKSINVIFDSSIPNIGQDVQIIKRKIANITLVNGDTGNITCSGHLEDATGVPVQPAVNIDNERVGQGKGVSRSYTNLADENYNFAYKCSNKAGNYREGSVAFSLDNDRIHTPLPFGPVSQGSVEMSVETDEDADCRYIEETGAEPDFEKMTHFDSKTEQADGKFKHSSIMYPSSNEKYFYDVRCRFQDREIEGKVNDAIRFAFDNQAPQVTPVSTFEAYGFDSSQEYGARQTLMLQCRDASMNELHKVKNMDFGCNRTTYTYVNPEGETVTGEFEGDGMSAPFTIDSSQGLTYSTIDNGGNDDSGSIDVSIDTTDPVFNAEILKSPLTEISQDVEAVSYGEYVIRFTSDKPIAAAEAKAMAFGEDGEKDLGVWFVGSENFGKTQQFMFSTWELSMTNMTPTKIGINITAVVAKPGEFCSVSAALDENKKNYYFTLDFDATMPSATLLPKLEDYSSYSYPLRYKSNEGVYYTNQKDLFLSGKANVPSTKRVNFYVWPQRGYIGLQKSYDLSAAKDDAMARPPGYFTGKKGGSSVENFIGDSSLVRAGVKTGNYLDFGKTPKFNRRQEYGNYGEYFKITSDPYNGVVGLEGGLAEVVDGKTNVSLHSVANPTDWFGEYINLEKGLNYFLIKSQSRAGFDIVGDKYVIFYDPDAPQVISQVPAEGYTDNNDTPIGIVVREAMESSQLIVDGTDKVKLTVIENEQKPQVVYPTVKVTTDGRYYYYNLTYKFGKKLNGTYYVNFSGTDYATNPLTASESAKPAWIFTVNADSPKKPIFNVLGGTYYNGAWYAKRSPTFSLLFLDRFPVEILHYYENTVGNYIGVDTCKGIADGNLFVGCSFNPQLESRQIGELIEDEHQIIVGARKVFGESAFGPDSPVYLDKLIIDNIQPQIESAEIPAKVRENYEFDIKAKINNEAHDLNATLLLSQTDPCLTKEAYPLTQVSKEGNDYTFKLKLDKCDWASPTIKAAEGMKSVILSVADYAGNYDVYEGSMYLDLTPPDVKELHITVMPTKVISTGNYTTNQTEVLVKGNFSDDDVTRVFLMPGSYVLSPGQKPKYEEMSQLADISGKNFELTMTINGTFNKTTLNNFNVYMEDEAGYAATTPLSVVADMQPPYVVGTRVG